MIMAPRWLRRSGLFTPMRCNALDRSRRSSSGIRISLPWPSYCAKPRRPRGSSMPWRLLPMPTLRELQAMFRHAMFGAEVPPLVEAIAADGLAPVARLQIYRHHVLTSLTEALQATFPVVCRLADARFFGYAADTYIRQHPPEAPCLFEYGAHFPAFLATFPPCRDLVYLADVARLAWALHAARHAQVCAPLDPAELWRLVAHEVAQLTFQFDLSVTLLRSPWPIDQIWRMNQAKEVEATVDLSEEDVCLEIRRWDDDVGFRRLAPPIATFRTALAAGQPLAVAADAALAADAAFDCVTALHELFTDGVVIGFTLASATMEVHPCVHP